MKFRRRRRDKNKYIKKFVIYFSILLVLAAISYYVFFLPGNINSGIVLDRNESSKYINIKLGYDGKTKWVRIGKNKNIPSSLAYNVQLEGFRVKSITPCTVYEGRVLARSSKDVLLDNKSYAFKPGVSFVKDKGGELVKVPASDVIVGSSTSKFISDKSGHITSVLVGDCDIRDIRVGISNWNLSSLDHTSIIFTAKKGLKVESSSLNFDVKRGDSLKADYKDGNIILSITTKKDDAYILKSTAGKANERIKIYSASDHPISIANLKRTNSYVPTYYGNFELFPSEKAMRLINEVNIEDYLRFVVPSEMLGSGGVDGYKVQAVAARTYVISDMLSGRFSSSGFHVDDTTLSQVYNSAPSNAQCDQALEETKGIIMTYDGRIIDAKYYSTSCGLGAQFNQVWYTKNKYNEENPEPYISFNDFTGKGIDDLSNEEDASEFFKDWTIKAYDSNSPYFRWKFTLDKKALNETINSNIYTRYQKDPESFKKQWHFNIYVKASIPPEGIGKILDININKRGRAGNVLEMTIVSEKGTYKVQRDINIKRLLTPKTGMEITPLYGKKMENVSAFPSSFFVFDKEMYSSGIKSLTVYGGGYGHGAGMSQYGVIGLVRQGKTFEEILNTFYKNIEFHDYHDLIKSLS